MVKDIPRQWQSHHHGQHWWQTLNGGSTGGTNEAENQNAGSNTGGSSSGDSPIGAGQVYGVTPASTSSTASPASSSSVSTGGSSSDSTTSGSIVSNSSSNAGSASGASVSNKKGAGVWAVSGLGDMVAQIGATWAYDWTDHPENSFTISTSVPAGIDLVAMIKTSTDISSLSSSSYKEVIGYNEPDLSAGPGVDKTTAINNWPAVVATGKRIGSPAPANTKLVAGDWFYDFMEGIKAKGSHVDFICLHHYAPTGSVSDFQSYIESVYNMYKLPIWVTEWAYVDYNQNPPKVPSTNEQVTYMQAAARMMDGLSYVERYAWFAVPQNDAQVATMLFNSDGSITAMGTAYKAL